MLRLLKLSELGTNNSMFINCDNVQYIKVDGRGTAVFFSKDDRILVNEKPEAIAATLAAK